VLDRVRQRPKALDVQPGFRTCYRSGMGRAAIFTVMALRIQRGRATGER
jgi:hypothetical protein